MATTRTRPIAPPADPAADAAAPRIIVFGLPQSGKTALIAAIVRQVTAADGIDAVPLEPAGADTGIRRELVPRIIRIENRAAPDGEPFILFDCDGKAAGELLAHPDAFIRGAARGALASAIRSADALILTVDAHESEADDEETFASFRQFLDGLEEGRTFGREVGGLPVFLTLTKCDTLHSRGDRPTEWLDAVSGRARDLTRQFEGYFGEHLADEEPAPYLPFGSIKLDVVWTATAVPDGRAFAPYADADGSFGIGWLVRRVLPAARAYRARMRAARRRLQLTVAGAGILLGVMLLGLLVLASSSYSSAADLLAERVRAYRQNEPPPAVRLADRNFARNLRELTSIRTATGFERLPDELREYVLVRVREFEDYREYRTKFKPPRLGPAEVRTRDQVDDLEAQLRSELAPPAAYADTWNETEAVRLWRKWRTDLELFREAEARLNDWYRGLVRRGNQLLLTEKSPDFGWRGQVAALFRDAAEPPVKPEQEIEASSAVPILRGRKLTYAPAFAFERVDQSRRDWADTRQRLTYLRDLTDALGLTSGPGTPAPVLDLPEPGAEGSRDLAAVRLATLRSAFPAADYPNDEYPEWSVNNFPDPVRQVLQSRLRTNFETGVRHVRRMIASAVGPNESHEEWQRVANGLLREDALAVWGRLLRLYRTWAEPIPAPRDPVQELAEFLLRDRFDVNLKALTVAIPDDLLDQRLVPSGRLIVMHTPVNGSPIELQYRQEGDVRRERPLSVYSFVPDSHGGSFTVRPGDGLTATLSLRSGTDEYRLVWTGGRSAVYQLDHIAQPPRLERVGPIPTPVPATGARLTVSPPDGLPAVPVLLPDLRGAK